MSLPGRTGLVVPVPVADDLVARVRATHPHRVRPVPAHVTMLYPFVPAHALTSEVTDAVALLCAGRGPVTLTFDTVARGPGIVYLPAADPTLTGLVAAVRARWPDLPPYGGAFGDPPPHLTLATGTDPAEADTVAAAVGDALPLRATLSEGWLVAFTDRWTVRARFPLG